MCAEIDSEIHSFLVGDDTGMLTIVATTREINQVRFVCLFIISSSDKSVQKPYFCII